ncbi:MAG: hypothetical protein FWC57_05655 [Endomicrobia bacterium]|nr:hypothetical protein [Endomicrobiia bacterium]
MEPENLAKKAVLYKNMFIISTVSGMLGVYCLVKDMRMLGWILVGVWAVLGAAVRIMIFRDKKRQ